MRLRVILKLPREHGAWAMLYVPLVSGLLVARAFPMRVLLFVLSATFLFIARESSVVWWRAHRRGGSQVEALERLLIYLVLAGLSIAPLLFIGRLYLLAPLGAGALLLLAINAEQAARREDRTISGEILAIAGLTMTAPAAHYVAVGELQTDAFWLWSLSALYFVSSVFYVKLRVNAINPRRQNERKRAWRRCASYHLFLLVALLLLLASDRLSFFAVAAFAPAITRASWSLGIRPGGLEVKRLGVLEIMYSFVFLVFITLAFRPV